MQRLLKRKLAKMEGVKSAKVDFEKKSAIVEYDEAIVTTTSLESTVTNAGDTYSVNDMKTVDVFFYTIELKLLLSIQVRHT